MAAFLFRLSNSGDSHRRNSRRRFRARLETLEDRTTPACISPDAFMCTPLPVEGSAVHIHPQLRIIINGQDVLIPANIGISQQGFLPIHTHDASGRIHVESPVVRGFTLKDFFDTWGFTFSNREVVGYVTETARPMQMTVNGLGSMAFGALPLRDGDQIVIRADGAFPFANLTAAASTFTHSAEHYRFFITQSYNRYLGRGPDSAGLEGWVVRMQHGLSDEQLEAGFIGSAEYIANHGGTGAAWVRGLYQDLLGRTPDQGGLQAWLTQLDGGALPYHIALGFAASAEREGMRVREDYITFLGRNPSQPEVDGWVGLFLQGASNEDVVAGFAGSREYFYSPNKGRGTRADWVRSIYRDVLHRTPSDGEVNAWVAALGR
jgi:Domain of unknown function (DUF4214)